MDTGYSTLRTLLWFTLVLALLSVISSFYVASQLARNSEELASLRLLVEKQVMSTAMTQSVELEKRMDALNQTAGGMDGKLKQAEDEMDARMKKAQDEMVARMQEELPKMMDNYIKQRAPALGKAAEKQLEKHGVPTP